MDKRHKMVLSGDSFESLVGNTLAEELDCIVKYNLRFFSPRINKGLECDVIVITPFKIYVIECKNYSTSISGKSLSTYWSFISSHKRGFVQNPILLNDRRVRTLKGQLRNKGLDDVEIVSLVCVPASCRIINDNNGVVVNYSVIPHKIKQICEGEPKLDMDYVSNIIDEISWR